MHRLGALTMSPPSCTLRFLLEKGRIYMDEKTYQEIVVRLQQVNGVITKLDPAIRSEAFSLLKAYVSGSQPPTSDRSAPANGARQEDTGPDLTASEEFFTTHEGGKPAENAYLVAAYLYSQHGTAPFSTEDVRTVANHAGLTLPERVDVTLGQAKKGGKQLFKRAGRGKLQPNVHGETYLKNTYDVTKGKKPRSA